MPDGLWPVCHRPSARCSDPDPAMAERALGGCGVEADCQGWQFHWQIHWQIYQRPSTFHQAPPMMPHTSRYHTLRVAPSWYHLFWGT